MADFSTESRTADRARGSAVARVSAVLLLCAWAGEPPAQAVPTLTRQKQAAIVLDAQSADNSMDNVIFRKVKITQGDMSIAADQGQGQGSRKSQKVDFDDSVWVFRGNVKITVAQGNLAADDAEITFVKQQLSRAVAHGDPATFEERVAKNGKQAHGHADSITYDAVNGIVSLLKNAWLSDGQTEVHGDTVHYNVLNQSIAADSTGEGTQRVHIVVPPPAGKP